METNTELLNRIEAHIKGRLAVAESRAASSEIYEGKKIAYNSILGFVNSLRADLAATTAENTEADTTAQARPVPADVQEAAKAYSASASNGEHFRDLETGFLAGVAWRSERLASCPTIKGWVMRDKYGSLKLYEKRPYKIGKHLCTCTNYLFIKDTLFPDLREDEPKPVRVIIEEIKE